LKCSIFFFEDVSFEANQAAAHMNALTAKPRYGEPDDGTGRSADGVERLGFPVTHHGDLEES
jgi:hypothetical protein